jgi:hypothetical protein
MDNASQKKAGPPTAEVLDFDEASLATCAPALRAELIAEAAMLVQAFAPEGRAEQVLAMAAALTTGARDDEMDPARARQLATALRCLAHGLEG